MSNRLGDQTSPYLLQHADNPVDWYPWGEEALALARDRDRPILLSIGYSACHWCHVMAHESFEDPAIARKMNDLFVNIKVDREERPDIDRIYQLAHHLLTRNNGGWPLTMFLTPDQVPFFGGTYFPSRPRHGLPGFPELLERVSQYYRERRDAIGEQNTALLEALGQLQAGQSGAGSIDAEPLNVARRQAEQSYDPERGGFGPAPKFPHPSNIERLLRHHAATALQGEPDEPALAMATGTLTRMAEGGIYDQLGGGFCRYSVDAEWTIPHFEKMLYDNGPLLALYAQAWQLTGDPLYRRTALETADWVLREMRSPEGGFYSSLDADSEGQEGKFYVWSRDEVEALLDADTYPLFARHFGLDRRPNFEGRWHLRVCEPLDEAAAACSMAPDEARRRVDRARAILLESRSRRVWPGRDDKILVSWNALMIKGLAVAGIVFERADYLAAAEQALDFIRANMIEDGRLLATYKDGRAHLNAYLDDYAFLVDAALALSQARWRTDRIEFAMTLAGVLLDQFMDEAAGGFWFTSHDHEQLIQRSKTWFDDALPNGNGVAAFALGRLGHILGDTAYLDAAERTLQAARSSIEQAPIGHNALLAAVEEYLLPPETVIIRGTGEALADWRRAALQHYAPRRQVLAIPAEAGELPGHLAEREARGPAVAYLCRGLSCSSPILEFAELEQALADGDVRGETRLQ